MKKKADSKSPLEKLSAVAQQQMLPVKVKPKSRFEDEAIIPLIEDPLSTDLNEMHDELQGLIIANSSLVMNFNLNIDDKAIDKAVETTKQVAKGLAAAGAAMLGTALLFNNKSVDKVKIPVIPKIKVPNLKRTT